MGKFGQNLQQQQSHDDDTTRNQASSRFFCARGSMVLSTVSKEFSFKCFLVLILSLAVFLSWIFWILPSHKIHQGFDAKEAIKLSATVKAYFRLQKPVSELVPHIGRLEYDIYGEIGVPDAKVAILSMHQSSKSSNLTDVVFGMLSDPTNVPINPVSLSVLRSSLIELFLGQSNLTLSSIFGLPIMFEILKFPGGITVVPLQSASIWQMPQILFNFTLNNSIAEIEENFVQFGDQLKCGLHLRPYENVYVQITNKGGSTTSTPVTVQASVFSNMGTLLPQRLKQLAHTIADSPTKNLGLDHSVFGKVNSVILSSYLNGTIHATPPTPSPAPSPEPSVSPYHASSLDSPAPSPDIHHLTPCLNCEAPAPSGHSHIIIPPPESGPSPAPSATTAHPPPSPHRHRKVPPSFSPTSNPKPTSSPPMVPPESANDLSPLPAVSYGSSQGHDMGSATAPVSPSLEPSPSSLAVGLLYKERWLLGFSGLLLFHILCWSY